MRATMIYGPGDIRVEDRPDPTILTPTDAIIRLSATCVCGSDLWDYRGINQVSEPTPMGHEYVGVVEAVGADVTTVRPGQTVIGSFFASDNTCPLCQAGYQSACVHREFVGTGWFGAVAADVAPGKTVAVVGDGAVGLLAILAARRLGAERVIAMSRHESRQRLATVFGATDIVTERGDDGIAAIKDLTDGLGAHSVIEAVGTQQSMMQAIGATRPGGHVGYVGVAHDVTLPGQQLFYSHAHQHGGPAPVRAFLPDLIDLITDGTIDPGQVFDLTLPLDKAAEGYQAMDQRTAIKTLLQP